MLNQHEFTTRYIFILQRIANGFSREDMAFLFGRTSYHVIDYEEFSVHVKMDYQDHEGMAALFKGRMPVSPAFNTKVNKLDISNEKRMIRGSFIETAKERHYHFIHPWTIKGINAPITIVEPIQIDTSRDAEILNELTAELDRLIGFGYFNSKISAIGIYHHIWLNTIPKWRIRLAAILKLAIFKAIHAEKIQPVNARYRVPCSIDPTDVGLLHSRCQTWKEKTEELLSSVVL